MMSKIKKKTQQKLKKNLKVKSYCPFCNEKDEERLVAEDHGGIWWVTCYTCFSQGPSAVSEKESIMRYRKREGLENDNKPVRSVSINKQTTI